LTYQIGFQEKLTRKEETTVNYDKPQVAELGDAAQLIQGTHPNKLEPDQSGPPGVISDLE
jgi:hypothetical protein